MREINKLDDRPWDIVAAFKDLNQRLAMEAFCQRGIVIDYPDYDDIKPDLVVIWKE